MKLRQLFEAPGKTAVVAFGRMNPPTIGHAKLVGKIKSISGDHLLFLSQTVNSKDNPLPFDVKLQFAQAFFPDIEIGDKNVRTPIQMMQELERRGYTDIIYIAGSDRIGSFEKLFNDYNGKEYNFNSIEVVSAGERDPDAEGVEGMSASKLRKLAAEGKFKDWKDEEGKTQPGFARGVPKPELARDMYDAVRKNLRGVKDTVEEGNLLKNPKNTFLTKSDTAYDFIKVGTNIANLKSVAPGSNASEPDIMIAPYAGEKEMKYLMKQLKRIGYDVQDAQGYKDAHVDEGDLVLDKASLVPYLKDMISDYLEREQDIDKLSKILKMMVGKEIKSRGKRYTITGEDMVLACEDFNEIMAFGIKKSPKRTTIKKKPEKFEPSVQDKIKARRAAAAKGDKDAWTSKFSND